MSSPTVLLGNEGSARRIGLFGVPYDSPTSLGRPGARYAPERIRGALRWNLHRVRDGAFYDVEGRSLVRLDGLALLDFGDSGVIGYDHAASLEEARRLAAEVLDSGTFPLALGGDHAVSAPLLKAFHDRFEGPLGILHVDAHLDLVDENPVQGRYSGSSPMRRALELGRFRPGNLVQVGVRGFNYPDQYEYIQSQGIHHITASEVHEMGGLEAAARALEYASAGGARVYLSLDMDALDYPFAPGTGADEGGGLTSSQVLRFIRAVAPRIDGMDIVETNPVFDRQDVTSGLAAQIVFTVLSARAAAGI